MPPQDHYAVLGVSRKATQKGILQAYRQKAKQYHPDVNDSRDANTKMAAVNEAYAVLSDSEKRAEYDRLISVPAAKVGRSGTYRPQPDGGIRQQTQSAGANRTAQESQEAESRRKNRERIDRENQKKRDETRKHRDAARKEYARQKEKEDQERKQREQLAREAQERQERAEQERQERREQVEQERRERLEQAAKEWDQVFDGIKVTVNDYTLRTVRRRSSPYIWISWLSKLLSGPGGCEWAAWFKTHHVGSSWEKVPADFTHWHKEHNYLLERETKLLKEAGAQIQSGDATRFNLNLGKVTLGGNPDLVSWHPDGTVVIHDCKTGLQLDEHILQVKLYLWVLSHYSPPYQRKASVNKLEGRLVYPGHEVRVALSEIDSQFVAQVWTLIDRLVAGRGACRSPSVDECRFCDIPRQICDDRIGN